MELRGRATYLGNETRFRLVADTAGRFHSEIDGPLPAAQGFDGERGWVSTPGGVSHTSSLGELEGHRLVALVRAGLWREPSTGVVIERLPSDAQPRISLRFGSGPEVATAQLDGAEGDLSALQMTSSLAALEYRFSDHRDIEGRRVPGAVQVVSGDQATESFRLDAAERMGDVPSSECAKPARAPRDWSLSDRTASDVALRRAPTGHLLVEASIDGGRTGWFILDSGAQGHAISPAIANSSAMSVVGRTLLASVEGIVPAALRQARSLTIGPLALERPQFVEMDLAPFSPALGVELAGIVGFDYFRRAVVEVDLAANRLRVHRRESVVLDELTWHPLTFDNGHPLVRASIRELKDGWFRIDLGASSGPFGNVIFTSTARRSLDLGAGKLLEEQSVGDFTFAFDTLPWIELLGRRFENKLVAYSTDEQGLFSDRYTIGNIGADLLAGMRVVFDYERERIALAEP